MNLSPRENWRIYLLLVLLLVSTVAVFVPPSGANTATALTSSRTTSR